MCCVTEADGCRAFSELCTINPLPRHAAGRGKKPQSQTAIRKEMKTAFLWYMMLCNFEDWFL
jgi:hypothetical protein